MDQLQFPPSLPDNGSDTDHHRIKSKLKGLSPVQYRTQSLRP
ncbi:IS3 family transposase [Herbaspirillum rubrisubalbicans]